VLSFFARNRTILAASLVLPCVAILILRTVAPGQLHASTFTAIAAFLGATGIVGLSTWKHAQPVASLRQELYEIEHPAGKRPEVRGRVLAVFGLSVALTAAITYAWLA
jgi:hypothetical protein